MKIQLITRHYWPDSTPGARLHHAIFKHLAQQGHDVHVFTAQPSYNDLNYVRSPEKQFNDGITIRRISLLPERKSWIVVRLINLLYFQLRSVWHALRCSTDLIFVSSYPPVVPGFCAWLVHRLTGTPYVYHCLDIQPESATLIGKLKSKRLTKFLRWIDRRTCERASAVVTLSEEMAQTLKDRGWDGKAIRLINNFHTEPLPAAAMSSNQAAVHARQNINHKQAHGASLPESNPRAFQIVFAGNMGTPQGLDLVIKAAWLLSDRRDIRFIFMGAGEHKDKLQEQSGELNGETVHFIPFQPVEVATTVVRGSDLAIVSMLPRIFTTAVPSKTMMLLRAGCPILALIEPDCELAQLIRTHSLGTVPAAREPQAVADAILAACDDSARVEAAERQRLIDVGESMFGYDRTLEKWTRLINALDANSVRRALPKRTRRAA